MYIICRSIYKLSLAMPISVLSIVWSSLSFVPRIFNEINKINNSDCWCSHNTYASYITQSLYGKYARF